MNLKELQRIGFVRAGQWKYTDKVHLYLDEIFSKKEEVLYCFVVNNGPKYFGISDNSLKSRMDNYKYGYNKSAGRTNQVIYQEIKETKEVDIYVLISKESLEYMGYPINLAKGLELILIKKATEAGIILWNKRGK